MGTISDPPTVLRHLLAGPGVSGCWIDFKAKPLATEATHLILVAALINKSDRSPEEFGTGGFMDRTGLSYLVTQP